jgi:methylmalonyl-CoA/ethylmalonyl-CoA epimerase
MKFHHIGIATKDIDKTLDWVSSQFKVIGVSNKVYDKNQDAYLQMIETSDMNIELVSGNIVKNFIERKITYYHVCYEVRDIEKSILEFEKSMVISKPKEALLFDNRRVAFLMTPIGIIELLEFKKLSNS